MADSIERMIELNAPIDKVWRALTDYNEFGTWFRANLHSPFETGKITTGEVTLPGHEGLPFWARVEIIEEPNRFSFVWPFDETVAPDDLDLQNKVTLVEFTLERNGEGTKLSVRESGFERLPENKRLQVFRENEGGWDFQMVNITTYVDL